MSNKPDYRLKVLNKKTEATNEVGAGWLNQNGSISITLNECIVLTRNPDQLLTLFPMSPPPFTNPPPLMIYLNSIIESDQCSFILFTNH